MYKIYWIKYEKHKDPTKDGYIGLTSQTIEKRLSLLIRESLNNGS